MDDDTRRVEAALGGDHGAFEELVRKYQSVTFALALARVGKAAAAEEIAQDAFIRAYQKLNQLKDASRFGAWLRSIALRQCGMWVRAKRRKARTRALAQEEMKADLGSAGSAEGVAEPEFDIAAMIQELPEGLRAAAVLCLEDELSPSGAADVLGIKPGALRKRLHDARAKLQAWIVERAEKQLRLHLLPKDFAKRCVCRCKAAQEAEAGKEVISMAEKKDCGCGCMGKRQPKPKTKDKPKDKK